MAATVSAKQSGDGVCVQRASIAQRSIAGLRRAGALLMNKTVLALQLSVVAGSMSAQPIAVHGWIDGYSAWNDARPDSRLNFFDGVGTRSGLAGGVLVVGVQYCRSGRNVLPRGGQ